MAYVSGLAKGDREVFPVKSGFLENTFRRKCFLPGLPYLLKASGTSLTSALLFAWVCQGSLHQKVQPWQTKLSATYPAYTPSGSGSFFCSSEDLSFASTSRSFALERIPFDSCR